MVFVVFLLLALLSGAVFCYLRARKNQNTVTFAPKTKEEFDGQKTSNYAKNLADAEESKETLLDEN